MMIQDENICTDDSSGIFSRENRDTRIASFIYNSPKKRNRIKTYIVQKTNKSPSSVDCSNIDIGLLKLENISFPSQIDILHDIFSPEPSSSALLSTSMLVNFSTQHVNDVFLTNESTFIPESPVNSNTPKNIDSQICVNISTLLPQTATIVANQESNIGTQCPSGNLNVDSDDVFRRTFTLRNLSVAHDSSNHHMKATEDNSLSPVVPFVLLPLNNTTTLNHEEELQKNEPHHQSKALANVEIKSQDNAATLVNANSVSVSDESSAGAEFNHIVDTLTDSLILTKRHNPKMKMPGKKIYKALRNKDSVKLDEQNNNPSSKTVSVESCGVWNKPTRITFTVEEVKKSVESRSQPIPEIHSQKDHLQNSKTMSNNHIPNRKSSLAAPANKKMQSGLSDSVTANCLRERGVNQLEQQSNGTQHDNVQNTRRTVRSRITKSDQNTEVEKTKSHTIGNSLNKPKSSNKKGVQETKNQCVVEKVSNVVKNNRQKENNIVNKINRDSPAFKKNSKAQESQLQPLNFQVSRKSIDKACSLINAKEVYVPPTKNASSFSGSQLVMAESDIHSSADNLSEDNHKEKSFPKKELPIKNRGRKKVAEQRLIQKEDSKDHIATINEKKSRATKKMNKQQIEAIMDNDTENTLGLQPLEQAMSAVSNVEEKKGTSTASQTKKKENQPKKLKAEQKPTVEPSARPVRKKKTDTKDSNKPVLAEPKLQVKEETEIGKSSKQKVKPLAEKKEPKLPVNMKPSRGKKQDLGKHSEEQVISGSHISEQELKVEYEDFTEGKVKKTHSLPEQQEPKRLAGSTARPSRKKNQKLQSAEGTDGNDLQASEKEDVVKPKATRKGRAKNGNSLAEKPASKQPVSAKPVRGVKKDSKKEQGEPVIGDVQLPMLEETESEGKSQEPKVLVEKQNQEKPFGKSEKPLRKKRQDTKKEPEEPVELNYQPSLLEETNSEDLKGGQSQKLNVLPENEERKKTFVSSKAKPSRNKKQDTKNMSEDPVKSGLGSTKQEDTKQVDETKGNVKKTKSKQTAPVASSVQLTASKEAGDGSKLKYVGVHCSISGGLSKAVFEAISYGARSFGLFLRNGRNWTLNTIDEKEVDKFKRACSENNYFHNQILPHGSYLLNCGSSSSETLKKSRETLIHELKICEKLGLTLYTFHPGSACHGNSVSECLKTIAKSINLAHQETKCVKTVIENMSGQGKTIGGKLEELKAIIDNVEDKSRIGVCLDTCHAFAAGYNIATRKGYEQFMKDFDDIIGLEYLCAVHLNDAKEGLGSNSDRHENIGKGHIGLDGFRHIMNDPRFNNLPMILETPKTNYAAEIKTLYELESA